MLPAIHSSGVAAVMVSMDAPQACPAVATMATFPALRAVIMTPPTVVSGCKATIVVSDADQVTVAGSTFTAMAGIWNWWTPSKAEYMGEKKTCRSLVLQRA